MRISEIRETFNILAEQLTQPVFDRLSATSQKIVNLAREALKKTDDWYDCYGLHEYQFEFLDKELSYLSSEGDKESRLRLMKQLAARDAETFLKSIWTGYKCSPEATISETEAIEILKICAEHHAKSMAESIHKYEVQSEDDLIEIVQICADHNPDAALLIMEKQKIKKTAARLQIAGLCAIRNGETTAEHIKKFEIEDEAARIVIAKYCAKKWGWATSKYIKNFEITDEAALIDIAKCCASDNGWATSNNIKNFGITNEAALIEIAMLCIESGKYDVAHNLPKFGIKDEQALINIALAYAENKPEYIADAIQYLGITDLSILAKLARKSALVNPRGTSESMRFFRITNTKILVEIAKQCLGPSKGHSSMNIMYIKSFGNLNANDFIEIIKHLALIEGEWTMENMRRFKDSWRIEDDKAVINLMKIAIYHEKNTSPEILFQSVGWNYLSDNIKNELQSYCVQCHLSCITQTEMISHEARDLESIHQLNSSRSSENIAFLKVYIKKMAHYSKQQLAWFHDQIAKLEDPSHGLSEREKDEIFYVLLTKTKLFISMYSYLELTIKDRKQREELMESDLINLALNYWQPHLRWHLFHAVLPLYTDRIKGSNPVITKIDQAFSLTDNKFRTKLYATELIKVLALQGVDIDLLKTFLDLVFSHAQNFKDGKIGGLLIQLLLNLVRDPYLEIDLKTKILQKIIAETNRLREIDFLKKYNEASAQNSRVKLDQFRKVYERKNGTETQLRPIISGYLLLLDLKKSEVIFHEGDINETIQKIFVELVPMGPVDQFSEKFIAAFRTNRMPQAIFQYASNISQTGSKEALQCLGDYITSVLNGTFQSVRYDTNHSVHLQTIAKSHPQVLEAWKKGASYPLHELCDPSDIMKKEPFNYSKWLCSKIVDGHLPMDALELDYLKQFKEKTHDPATLINDIKEKLRIEEENSDNFKILNFQLLCLELNLDIAGEIKIKNLLAIQSLLEASPFKSPEFLNDVNGQLESRKRQERNGSLVVDSDHPLDLLLAGTEVAGSCQRVDGNHGTNRGLLGYLLNGWNRILKVSDTIEGPIQARCMLRLLWDGERPVLFRERFYPFGLDLAQTKALNAMARRCAERLGVPLLSLDPGDPYNKPIHALGGPGTFEYSDACVGVRSNGIYTINEPRFVG